MDRRLVWLLLLGCVWPLSAQTIVQKSINSEEEYFIQILAKQCFKVEVYTSDNPVVTVEAVMDEEYQDNLLIPIVQEGSTLTISTSFNSLFKKSDIKLNALRAPSIALRVQIPHGQRIEVQGTVADVTFKGRYRELEAALSTGKCTLLGQAEKTTINTQKGDIVLADNAGSGNARSRFGEVFGTLSNTGSRRFSLQSIEGNIYLSKIEE